MSELMELAAKCEGATGRSISLNRAIALAVGWRECPGLHMLYAPGDEPGRQFAPDFTASIDAAMTLLPPTTEMERPISFNLQISESGNLHWASIKSWKWGKIESTACKSLPLAFCAAALRARAAQPSAPYPLEVSESE